MTEKIANSVKLSVIGVLLASSFVLSTASHAEALGGDKGARQTSQVHSQSQRADNSIDGPYSEASLDQVAEILKLDPSTKDKAARLFAEAREEHRNVINGLKDLREPVHELRPTSDDYVEQVTELAEKRGELMTRLDVQQAKTRHAFYAMLTDQQISAFESLSEQS